jgi:acetylornithine deacetylase/succinyl-diaminopimelate desuccinylase-like protein
MDKVLGYLKGNKKRFIQELIDYVSIPSVSAQEKHKADMRKAADWIAQRARGAGLDAKIFETKGHPIHARANSLAAKAGRTFWSMAITMFNRRNLSNCGSHRPSNRA